MDPGMYGNLSSLFELHLNNPNRERCRNRPFRAGAGGANPPQQQRLFRSWGGLTSQQQQLSQCALLQHLPFIKDKVSWYSQEFLKTFYQREKPLVGTLIRNG